MNVQILVRVELFPDCRLSVVRTYEMILQPWACVGFVRLSSKEQVLEDKKNALSPAEQCLVRGYMNGARSSEEEIGDAALRKLVHSPTFMRFVHRLELENEVSASHSTFNLLSIHFLGGILDQCDFSDDHCKCACMIQFYSCNTGGRVAQAARQRS